MRTLYYGFGAGVLLQLALNVEHAVAGQCDFQRIRWTEDWTLLCKDIGLAPGAEVSLEVHTNVHRNNTYLLMLSNEQYRESGLDIHFQHPRFKRIIPTGYIRSAWRSDLHRDLEANFRLDVGRNGLYVLLVYRSDLSLEDSIIGSLHFVNPGGQQLRLQDVGVPPVLVSFSVASMICSIAYGLLLLTCWRHRRTRLHHLMMLVFFFRGLVLMSQWHYMQMIHSGRSSKVAQLTCSFLEVFQKVMELLLYMLVALGWQYLRAGLNFTEIRFVAGTSMISLYLGMFQVVSTSDMSREWYRLSRFTLHTLCYLVVVVAMNYNLQILMVQMADWPARIEVGKLYQKHRAYTVFRMAFLVLITGRVMEPILMVSLIPWEQQAWTVKLLQELRLFIIYLCLLYSFRPTSASLRVFDLVRQPEVLDDEDDQQLEQPVAMSASLEISDDVNVADS
mmetsp:Transcript_20052/g.46697  ORF Transcript_20052/g.46697 Transcript_20052/m.46697 type:complete len:447 (+) Transcript_20052:97-1437(+)